MSDELTIHTERLRLCALSAEAIKSLLDGDTVTAGRLQRLKIPIVFLETIEEAFLKNQLERINLRPSRRGWCVRVIVREADGTVIGHCGFHGPPEDVGRAEIGYLVFENYRRNGYATEAALGLIGWAREQGAKIVFAAASPKNHASIRVAEKAGFRRTSVMEDEGRDEEIVFERNI